MSEAGLCLRVSCLFLVFAVIPLTVPLHSTLTQVYPSDLLNCQPSMKNQYPKNATVGQMIIITTIITRVCIVNYNEVIINILLPDTSIILSTSPANPAVNKIRAPNNAGPLVLVVQALFIYYPSDGITALFQNVITIEILKN